MPKNRITLKRNADGTASVKKPTVVRRTDKSAPVDTAKIQSLPFACDGCDLSSKCPQFKPGYVCAFGDALDGHKIESIEDIKRVVNSLLEVSHHRIKRMTLAEALTGNFSGADNAVGKAINDAAFLADIAHRMNKAGDDKPHAPNQSILLQLFGSPVIPEKYPHEITADPAKQIPAEMRDEEIFLELDAQKEEVSNDRR